MSILKNAPESAEDAAMSAAAAPKVTQLPSTADKALDVTSQIGNAAHKGLSYAVARRERASQALND